MVRAFLIKYAEIGIKGKNRYVFENALVRRVRERLDRCVGEFMVEEGARDASTWRLFRMILTRKK